MKNNKNMKKTKRHEAEQLEFDFAKGMPSGKESKALLKLKAQIEKQAAQQ
jgi:hypothetical protein